MRTESWLASLGYRLQDFPQSWFYSDSINDVPLLERVTHPVATNPDPRLRAIAAERGLAGDRVVCVTVARLKGG